MAGKITIKDDVLVNRIVWIRSLNDDEHGPSNRMVEDIKLHAEIVDMGFESMEVSDCSELDQVLQKLADEAKKGLRPILHFDCHGSANDGLLLSPSNQRYSWERLNEKLREINVSTENNLCCLMGLCHGLHYAKLLQLSKPTPFFILIAAEEEVSTGYLEENVPKFYGALLKTNDIVQAYNSGLTEKMSIFFCKKLFAEALARYVKDHCRGKAKQRRLENLLTRYVRLNRNRTISSRELNGVRKKFRKQLKPNQKTMDHFAKTFLIGRSPDCNFCDVRKLAGF